jgi:hypothetical protein
LWGRRFIKKSPQGNKKKKKKKTSRTLKIGFRCGDRPPPRPGLHAPL